MTRTIFLPYMDDDEGDTFPWWFKVCGIRPQASGLYGLERFHMQTPLVSGYIPIHSVLLLVA